jgi:hypothetical protein
MGVDQFGLVGMFGLQQARAFREAAAAILAAVPFMSTDRC